MMQSFFLHNSFSIIQVIQLNDAVIFFYNRQYYHCKLLAGNFANVSRILFYIQIRVFPLNFNMANPNVLAFLDNVVWKVYLYC